MELIPLGGALDPEGVRRPIGGSAYLVRCGGVGLLFEFGQYPISDLAEMSGIRPQENGPKKSPKGRVRSEGEIAVLPSIEHLFDRGDDFFSSLPTRQHLPAFHALDDLDQLVVLITHAHADHIGGLPFLVRRFPKARIYMSGETFQIGSWAWADSLKLARRQGRPLIFNEADIHRLGRNVQFITAGRNYEDGPFRFRFFPAGHILGAMSVHLSIDCGGQKKQVFFTGDICFHNQETIRGAPKLSRELLGETDLLITEATYGGQSVEPREAMIERLAGDVRKCLDDGGHFLFGALTVGRAQEIFAILKAEGITERYPVYIDGSARQLSEIYAQAGAMWLSGVRRHFVQDSERDQIIRSGKPCVMIAPAGMYGGGWSVAYAGHWAENPANVLSLTSYQDPCSPGYRLMTMQPGERMMFGEREVEVWAKVRRYQLSAHMDGTDLEEMVQRLDPAKTLLVHGEEASMDDAILLSNTPLTKAFLGKEYDF